MLVAQAVAALSFRICSPTLSPPYFANFPGHEVFCGHHRRRIPPSECCLVAGINLGALT